MSLGACIRHFCDRYEQARELLASALYDDDQETVEEKSSVETIDEALKKQEPEITTSEKIDKALNGKNPEPEKEKQQEEKLDLF